MSKKILICAALCAVGGAGAAWFDQADWLAAVTYRQAEDAIYLDTTGKLPPQVNVVGGTEPGLVVFELANVRVNPSVYTLAPRDGVVDSIRLEGIKEGGKYRVEVTVATAKPFKYDLERRQVPSGVSQVVLTFRDVDVERAAPSAEGKAPVFARPTATSQIVAFVPYYTGVEVYDYAQEMYLVKTPEGVLGWVPAKNLKIDGENPFVGKEKIPPAGIRDEILATAKKYLGVPYAWGGTSADGFDCSGLVQTVFAENGVPLPRGSGDQYRQGHKISPKNMAPGDLVFFHTYTSGPSHVGIYVGGGKFLHAESSPRGVTITPLAEPYWKERFLGARSWLAE